jgi:spore coat protein U-like protein
MKKKILLFMAVGVLSSITIGCGSGDSTTTSIDPNTGKSLTEKVDAKTGVKLDYLTVTPTDDGFKFKFENHSDSDLMCQYYANVAGNYRKTQWKIQTYVDGKRVDEFECKVTPFSSNYVSSDCLPADKNIKVSVPGNYSTNFGLDNNITFFSSKNANRVLAVIKYNSATGLIEVVK